MNLLSLRKKIKEKAKTDAKKDKALLPLYCELANTPEDSIELEAKYADKPESLAIISLYPQWNGVPTDGLPNELVETKLKKLKGDTEKEKAELKNLWEIWKVSKAEGVIARLDEL